MHVGDGEFKLTDPVDSTGITGVECRRTHDGSCGMMQFEQLESERNRVILGNAWKDILSQLPDAAAHARRRAERQGRDHQPELHLLVSCLKSRHRAEMTSGWAQQAFRPFLDVADVEIRRHHLRPGPHESRGRCGCHIDDCKAFRPHERLGAIKISAEYREETCRTALMLAAKVFNREMNGPRRIDAEGMWPAVSSSRNNATEGCLASGWCRIPRPRYGNCSRSAGRCR